ncbi:MAG: DedA family protein [Deltaproteobacteria bacterium]|nr:DedA family protein [Deltaproteobacteria bacterium]
MTLEHFIETYGYLALLVGTFLEGETTMVLAGLAAYLGYLSLPWAILVAFIGTIMGDQLFFYLGRWHSRAILASHPAWNLRLDKVQRLIDSHRMKLILIFRFLYGLRIITLFALGMSRIPAAYFFLLSALTALTWAAAMGIGGYLFGNVLRIIIVDIKRYEAKAFWAIAIIGGLIWGIYFYRHKRPLKDKGKKET